MVPESNPARRRCSRVESAKSAPRPTSRPSVFSWQGLLAVGATVAAFALLSASPLAANAAVSTEAAATDAAFARTAPATVRSVSGVILRIAPTVSTTITPGAPVTLEVEVENATAEPIAAGTIRVMSSPDAIDDTVELDAWLDQAPDTAADSSEAEAHALDGIDIGEIGTDVIDPGAVDVVSLTLPPEAIAAFDDAPVFGVGAELVVADELIASATDVFANGSTPATSPAALALAYPLTVPASPSGLLAADDLETWTSPFGLLTRQLDAVAGRPVAIAVDPRIIASIRVLGSSAPASATDWLKRLAEIPNEIFPLAYADADVAAQAQLGRTALLAPTAFTDVLDADDFAVTEKAGGAGPAGDANDPGKNEAADAGDANAATPTPTPTPTPPPTGGAVPTTEELLAWSYTRTDIAWPADDTISAGDLAVLGAAGLTTSILAPGNVAPASASNAAPNAASNVDGATAVVSDARLTDPLRAASEALSDTEWRAAAGQLGAELALIASEGRDAPATLLATFSRGAGTQSARVAATLDALATSPWVASGSLGDAIGAPPVDRALVDEPEAQQRIDNVSRIIGADDNIAAFSTVLDDPSLLSAPSRRDALALLDVAWLADRQAWDAATGEWLLAQRRTLGSVSVVPSSPINVVSTETGVPTTILNALPYPVTVVVDVAPSNGRLIVEDQATLTIDPESRSTVTVPVAAGIGSGEVTLTVSLTSPEGVPIGSPASIPVNVQADWEGLGAAIIGIIVVVFFGVGIWRNIRRVRKRRAEAAEAEAAESDASDGARTADQADAPIETDAPAETDAADAPAPESPATDDPDAERRDD